MINDSGRISVVNKLFHFLFVVVLLLIFVISNVFAADVTTAAVQISASGSFELSVNGNLLKKADKADDLTIGVQLVEGANDFLLKLYQGTTAMKYCVSSPWNCI